MPIQVTRRKSRRRPAGYHVQVWEIVTLQASMGTHATEEEYDQFRQLRDDEGGELRKGPGKPLVQVGLRPEWASYEVFLR